MLPGTSYAEKLSPEQEEERLRTEEREAAQAERNAAASEPTESVDTSKPATQVTDIGGGFNEKVSGFSSGGGRWTPGGWTTVAQPYGPPGDKTMAGGLPVIRRQEDLMAESLVADQRMASTEEEASRQIAHATGNAYENFLNEEYNQRQILEEEAAHKRGLIEAKQKKLDELDRIAEKEYSRPDTFFDARSNDGQTGILGFLSRITWALSSPDYQKNTIAATNSMIEQDYRNKMARREALQGRRGLIKDSLALFERGLADDREAYQAWKSAAASRVATTIATMAEKSKDPVLKARAAQMTAHLNEMYGQKQMQLRQATSAYVKPTTGLGGAGGGPSALNIKRSGDKDTINGAFKLGKDGRVETFVVLNDDNTTTEVPAFHDEEVVSFTIGGQRAAIVTGKNNETLRKSVVESVEASKQLTGASDALRSAAKAFAETKDPAQRRAIFTELDATLKAATRGLSMAQHQGTQGEAEYLRNIETVSKNLGYATTKAGGMSKEIRDWLDNEARSLPSQLVSAANGLDAAAREGLNKTTQGLPLASWKVQKVGNGKTAITGWVQTGEMR